MKPVLIKVIWYQIELWFFIKIVDPCQSYLLWIIGILCFNLRSMFTILFSSLQKLYGWVFWFNSYFQKKKIAFYLKLAWRMGKDGRDFPWSPCLGVKFIGVPNYFQTVLLASQCLSMSNISPIVSKLLHN